MKQKIILLSLCLFFSSSFAWALTVDEAFEEFYNHPEISSRHCGLNIQKFLKYLDEKSVKHGEGFVVSIHEDYAFVNHFDSRWGSQESYANGITYSRSNWYFHVFAVIDGKAYDFSQAGPVAMEYKDYLEKAYLPEFETQNVFFQGVLSAETERKKYLNLEMNIFELDQYRKKLGPKKYTGVFIELFNL